MISDLITRAKAVGVVSKWACGNASAAPTSVTTETVGGIKDYR